VPARSPRAAKAALAAEAWKLVFDFFMLTRPQRDRVLEGLGLTPNDVRALSTLVHAPEGRTMRDLAEAWTCDASNATWMVDRLEERGLAERRSQPGDRRVKLVALTPAGARMKARLLAGMYDPPPELLRLPRRALEALRDAAARLPRRPEGPLLGGGRRSGQ
jgi:DNA-binding MarR family transcriptional regulator